MLKSPFLLVALSITGSIIACAQSTSQFVHVKLDNGTFWGTNSGTFSTFLGIPFAKPPTGDLRFRLPVSNDPYSGTYDSTFFGVSCPQQVPPLDIPPGFEALTELFVFSYTSTQLGPWGEDCLTLNVFAPSNLTSGSKLPVIAYIPGGGFEDGGSKMWDPTSIIERSVEIGEPIIFVSMNHRVSAFGFLAGQEVKDAGVGNIGLHDQREGLRWIQKYISAFGGDTSRVTLWGESSGAISVAMQMLGNGGDTEGLFHGAIMNSGSPIPVGDLTSGQKYYDEIVDATGCGTADDTLQCLRLVPYATLKAAVDASPHILSYQSMNLAWLSRADGTFLPDDLQKLVLSGSVANVPFITGDLDDEGTLFALYSLNLTTDSDARGYIHGNYLPKATSAQIDKLLELYPQDPTQGSPFDTGLNNTLTPEFKRIASFAGDFIFQATRRFFLQQRSDKQDAWSFLVKRGKEANAPIGSYHGSDVPEFFMPGGDMIDYVVHFVNHFDPNGQNLTAWPKYTPTSPSMLTLVDGPTPIILTNDTYRKEAMEYLTELSLQYSTSSGYAGR